MLKKLQSLLFEDEEDEELVEEIEDDEEEEEEVVEIKPAPRRNRRRNARPEPEPEPEPEPIPVPQYTAPAEPVKPAKPVLNRVEVTKTIPVQKVSEPSARPSSVFSSNDSVFKKPAQVPHATPRPVFEPTESAPTPDPVPVSSFGISADTQRPTNIRPASEARKQRPQAERPSAAKRPAQASVYEFRPVISPMFGVDEKDMQSVQYAPKKDPVTPSVQPVHESSKVISPIYGTSEQTGTPSANRPVSGAGKENPFSAANQQPEEEKGFPEFSLDDILSARDEEFSRQNYYNNPNPIRTPDIDETVVIDSNRFDPFDQQTLDFDRKK